MARNLNSVKTQSAKPARAYHHGDLHAALLAAAEAVIRERGVDGFSLRETARRAGVSPAAPAHHFGDARGLLTAVATAGFEELSEALAAANEVAPGAGEAARRARISEQGAAYVRFALNQPARFDVMWRKGKIDGDDPAYRTAAERAFTLLKGAIADDPDMAEDASVFAAWSLVHGFARLALDGALGTGEAALRAATDALLRPMMCKLDV